MYLLFLTFPAVIFSILSSNCSNLLDLRNLQGTEKYSFTEENIFLAKKTENFKNKVPLLASACVFLAHKEKEPKVHIPLISYFVSYAK